jgi:ubiquitin-conjugating enzyme E2 S
VGTPYEGKFFQFKLLFCHQYPVVAPRGFFLTKIYHPNVDMSTGAICVNTLKKDWTSATTLSHVLSVIRCLLIVPFPESSLNDQAGRLFMESYTEYYKRSKLMADVHGRSTSYFAHHAIQQQQNSNNEAVAENSSATKLIHKQSSSGSINNHYRSLSSSSSSDNPLQLSSSNAQNKVPTSPSSCPRGVLNNKNGCANDSSNPASDMLKMGSIGSGAGVGNRNRSNSKTLSTNKQKSKSLKRL